MCQFNINKLYIVSKNAPISKHDFYVKGISKLSIPNTYIYNKKCRIEFVSSAYTEVDVK